MRHQNLYRRSGAIFGMLLINFAGTPSVAREGKLQCLVTSITRLIMKAPEPVEKGGLARFPSVIETPLPKPFIESVHRTEAAHQLKQIFGEGEDLVLDAPRPSQLHSRSLGEAIQREFFRKTLEEVFPKARFSEFPAKSHAAFNITDTFEASEDGVRGKLPGFWHLEMADVKKANPSVGLVQSQVVRRALGVPEKSKIISLNTKMFEEPSLQLSLIRRVAKTKPNHIILSSANVDDANDFLKHIGSFVEGYEIRRLSSLDGTPIASNKRYLFINDTSGKMPYVYGMSNLNVTAGPINLSEPLLAGTPSIFFDSKSNMFDYAQDAFEAAGQHAVATRGAQAVSSLDELSAVLAKGVRRKGDVSIQPPYTVPVGAGPSPVETLTDKVRTALFLSADQKHKERIFKHAATREVYLRALKTELNKMVDEVREPRVDADVGEGINTRRRLRQYAVEKMTFMGNSPDIEKYLSAADRARFKSKAEQALDAIFEAEAKEQIYFNTETRQAICAMEAWLNLSASHFSPATEDRLKKVASRDAHAKALLLVGCSKSH